MKIIDILNKMANGELEDGFKFVYEDVVYKYEKSTGLITNPEDKELGYKYKLEKCLNDEVLLFKKSEVEVIEENKGIEELNKISYDEFKYTDTKHRFDLTNIEYDKINELARAVNKINKQLEKLETEDIGTVERQLNKIF